MKLTEKPHIPKGKCTLLIADRTNNLIPKNDAEIIYTCESNKILPGINTHPDMQVCHLGGGDIVVCEEFFDYYNNALTPRGFNVIKGENTISPDYPSDIAYNCVILKDTLYHKLSHTDRSILEYAERKQMRTVNVRQGYTGCSTLIVGERTVITSDKGLYKAYENDGIDVLYIDNKTIRLSGFDYGFIGGCGGMISEKEIFFFGNLKRFCEYNKIYKFLNERNIKITYETEETLTDFGGIIPLIHK